MNKIRTIKFRGKRTDTGKWIYGDLLTSNGTECEISDWDDVVYSRYDVEPDTVGQFTGLLDKNGKEIYEGDILLIDKVWNGNTGDIDLYNAVGIKDGCFGYIGENSGKLLPFCYNKVTEEIAGNIHDNPELLKGGKL